MGHVREELVGLPAEREGRVRRQVQGKKRFRAGRLRPQSRPNPTGNART